MPALTLVANRLPVSWQMGADGTRSLTASPGGLVSALQPLAARFGCSWLGWMEDAPAPTFTHEGMQLISVAPRPEVFEGYYHGFANQILWPIFHGLPSLAGAAPGSRESEEWWQAYRLVNQEFASRIAETAAPDSLVWVHDYHLLLVPELLRALRDDLRIAFFLHIPFPEPEALLSSGWAPQILRGLSAADLIGVQREVDAARLSTALQPVAPEHDAQIRAFPISIESEPYQRNARTALAAQTVAELREQLSLRFQTEIGERQLLLSVDRLDYTKGILERLAAFEQLLLNWPDERTRPVLVQVLTPSRPQIVAYREYARQVEAATHSLRRRFGSAEYSPVVTLHEPQSATELVELYLAADTLLVTPLRDGMNLVAKEFVASRIDEQAVLVLSLEAGSADELTDALLVDPRDAGRLAATLEQALAMSAEERTMRMRALRSQVLDHDVHAWAERFLGAVPTTASHAARSAKHGVAGSAPTPTSHPARSAKHGAAGSMPTSSSHPARSAKHGVAGSMPE